MAWFKRFVDPIVLPDGRELLTLRDAAEYITALPKAEHDAADWQVAMQTLILVAERDGPEMLARIAVMKALNRNGTRYTAAGTRSQVIGAKSQDATRVFHLVVSAGFTCKQAYARAGRPKWKNIENGSKRFCWTPKTSN